MKKLIMLFAISIMAFNAASVVIHAARPIAPKNPGGDSSTSTQIGYDISWPQCGSKLPAPGAFAIIGVNGGTAADTNDCLAQQLVWGNKSSGSISAQPHLQLYVNTANPGEYISDIDTWPKGNLDVNGDTVTNRYGTTCTGENDLACSWLYGWNRTLEAAEQRFAPAAREANISESTSDYIWWLDVETMNTWQSGSEDKLRKNVAALEGMADYFNSRNATVGLYSTAAQWDEITGNYFSKDSSLYGLANWRPSGSSLNNAIANCSLEPFSNGGFMSLTQFIHKRLDNNYSC